VQGTPLSGKFARLRGARRVWAVASIHGEARRLRRLHDLIEPRFGDGDRVVYLGNYLGFGGDVIGAVDELLDFRCRVLARQRGFVCDVAFLRGAQEEMWHKLLQLQFAPNPTEVLDWLVRAGAEPTIRAYGGDLRQGVAASRGGPRTTTRWTGELRSAMNAAPGHSMLFAALRHAAFTDPHHNPSPDAGEGREGADAGGVLFVPAAIDPSRPLAAQGDAFWWGDGDILALDAAFEGFRRVVRGIDRQKRGLVESEFAVSLDGGAGRGGPLLAACLTASGEVCDCVEA
jgi:serine/threonine protein phosphatase 1